jgi:hypothetical protein
MVEYNGPIEEFLTASARVPDAIYKYCNRVNLSLRHPHLGSVKIDDHLKKKYGFAVKYKVTNKVTGQDEIYLFIGRRAKYFGYVLLEARRIS